MPVSTSAAQRLMTLALMAGAVLVGAVGTGVGPSVPFAAVMAAAEGECPSADPTQPPVECPVEETTTTTAPPAEDTTTSTEPPTTTSTEPPTTTSTEPPTTTSTEPPTTTSTEPPTTTSTEPPTDHLPASHPDDPPARYDVDDPSSGHDHHDGAGDHHHHGASVDGDHREEADDHHDRPPVLADHVGPGAVGPRRADHVAAAHPSERAGARFRTARRPPPGAPGHGRPGARRRFERAGAGRGDGQRPRGGPVTPRPGATTRPTVTR